MIYDKKAEQIFKSLTAFTKEQYRRDEVLPELLKLQQEMSDVIGGSDREKMKIWDIESRLELMNDMLGNVADEPLNRFIENSKTFCNMIKALVSGNNGENWTFERTNNLRIPHRILRNVELNSEEGKSELDEVVVTSKGVFILEVKNTKSNIIIDEYGSYFRIGKHLTRECNIRGKMMMREALVKNVLASCGYPNCRVWSVLVFTNNRIEVNNADPSIKTTFLGTLPYIICNQSGAECLSNADMDRITDAINAANCFESYALEMDMNQYKTDFALVMAMLEEALLAPQEKNTSVIEAVKLVFQKLLNIGKIRRQPNYA